MGDRGFESSLSGGETVANLTSSIRVDPGRMAPGLAGLRVGAFWEPGDPALISLPGPAWLAHLKRPLVDRQKQVTAPASPNSSTRGASAPSPSGGRSHTRSVELRRDTKISRFLLAIAVGHPLLGAHRVTGGGRPPPVPTERGVRISRTTLFGRCFTAFAAICSSFVSMVG